MDSTNIFLKGHLRLITLTHSSFSVHQLPQERLQVGLSTSLLLTPLQRQTSLTRIGLTILGASIECSSMLEIEKPTSTPPQLAILKEKNSNGKRASITPPKNLPRRSKKRSMKRLPIWLSSLLTSISNKVYGWARKEFIQSRIAGHTFPHTLKETTHGLMVNTTNPMRWPGVERLTPLLLITSIGLQMMEEDWPQLLPPLLPRRDKNGFHSTMHNPQSLHMTRETMPGPTTKLTRPMKLNGKLTSQLLEPIISILLKIHWNFLLLLFRERDKSIQSKTASLTSHHTPKETTLGTMPSTTNPMRWPGVKRLMSLLPTTLTGLPTMEEDSPQLLPPLLPRRYKDIFHTTMLNLLSRHMIKEMMPGLIIKLTRLTKLNGKLTFKLSELIILILLKTHWFFQRLLFRERISSIQ